MQVWEFIKDKLNASNEVMLLYVLESEGSSPGRQGFKMAVAADGTFNGTIGGGIMEHKLVEKARRLLVADTRKIELMRQYHDKQQANDQSGMICSGSQLNAFIPVSITDKAIIDFIAEGQHKVIQISPQGFALMDAMLPDKDFELQFRSEDDWLYREKLNRQPVVHIVGGGHVSLALSELMVFLGFFVKLYDDRPALNTMEENHFANEKHIVDDYEKLGDHIQSSPDDYVVVITFGYRTDKVALKQLLDKKFAYLGLIGSDKKIETLFKEMEEEGIEPARLKSIFAPIGINIFSRTAHEIAVSIAAEIIREKNKGLPPGRQA